MLATVISIVGLIISIFTLLGIVFGFFTKVIKWMSKLKEQEEELVKIRLEQSILTIGVLACLKSLIGQKNENEVKMAIKTIEDHLNKEAHSR